jgi:hypothetical protein
MPHSQRFDNEVTMGATEIELREEGANSEYIYSETYPLFVHAFGFIYS